MKFQTQFVYNHALPKNRHEDVLGPSETIPGDNLEILDIFKRSLRGEMAQVYQTEVQYMAPEDIDAVGQYYRPWSDLTDLDALGEEITSLQTMQEAAIKKHEQDLADAKAKEAEPIPEPPTPEPGEPGGGSGAPVTQPEK